MPVLLILYVFLFGMTYNMYSPPKYSKPFPWVKFSTSLCFILIATYSAFLSQYYSMFYKMLPAFILAACRRNGSGLFHIPGQKC